MLRSLFDSRVALTVLMAIAAACGDPASKPGAVITPVMTGTGPAAGASARTPRAGMPNAGTTSSAPGNMMPSGNAGADADQPGDASSTGCATFDSSFAALQKVIFEGHGCTASACHGQAMSGGLDLRPDAAYAHLIDAASTSSKKARVQPGTATDSFLYEKLAARTNPDSVKTTGSPMPVGTAPLSTAELEAVRLWILKGAPETGTVGDPVTGEDVGSLLDACLPPAKPVKAKPLEVPAADEGIQFVLPNYVLKAGIELEQCTPFAYDFSDKVPAQYKDETRNVIFVNGSRVRQDPQSHHMVVWNPNKDLSSVSPNDAGWTCHGGDHEGQACDGSKGSIDCGESSVCAGQPTPGTLCDFDTTAIASGQASPIDTLFALGQLAASGGIPSQVANTQSPQEYIPPMDGGVYWEIPLSGVLWFNSHAFNLTDEDTTLDARMNFYYAKELKRQMIPTNVIDNNTIFDGQAPFTRKTYCATTIVPQNYSIAILTGHTHRHGERFWVNDPSGKMFYESTVYNDPIYEHFDPWMAFDAPDDAARTLEYCATYNNGLKKDDTPDVDLVTRLSRMPNKTTSCTPVACVAGKVAASCTTDGDCDTASGAGDGKCDACPLTAGTTTENEMFVLMPWYVLPEGAVPE
jgi:hypothetical protein